MNFCRQVPLLRKHPDCRLRPGKSKEVNCSAERGLKVAGVGSAERVMSKNFGPQRIPALLRAIREAEKENPVAKETTPPTLAALTALSKILFDNPSETFAAAMIS